MIDILGFIAHSAYFYASRGLRKLKFNLQSNAFKLPGESSQQQRGISNMASTCSLLLPNFRSARSSGMGARRFQLLVAGFESESYLSDKLLNLSLFNLTASAWETDKII